jgi:hypothetical protein
MDHERVPYMSYLLRLWLEDDCEHEHGGRMMCEWRASLQDPHTQEMQVFADLEALFDFLLAETARRTSGEDARQQEIGSANQPAHIPDT